MAALFRRSDNTSAMNMRFSSLRRGWLFIGFGLLLVVLVAGSFIYGSNQRRQTQAPKPQSQNKICQAKNLIFQSGIAQA